MVEEIHVNDLLAAYALGCLEPDEARRYLNIATCPLPGCAVGTYAG
jgi:hypothetical protein